MKICRKCYEEVKANTDREGLMLLAFAKFEIVEDEKLCQDPDHIK